MKQHWRTSVGAALVALSFFMLGNSASAQRLGAYYPGYRGAFYGGGNYGLGYFGTYRGSIYGGSLYGGYAGSGYGGYGGSFAGGGYIGYSPYLGSYGLGNSYNATYPGIYRPYEARRSYGSSLYSPILPDLDLSKPANKQPFEDPGHVVVQLPTAKAELSINGKKSKQKGKSRRFVSSPIAEGKSRTFEFTARWKENGTLVVRSRKVKLRAGQRKVIQFTEQSGNKNQSE